MSEPVTDTSALRAARAQRADLHEDFVALEQALSAPVPHRAGPWGDTVHDALVDLSATFERHLRITDGDGGLFAEIEEAQPRLRHAVDRLRKEHAQLRGDITAALDDVRAMAASREAATAVRDRVLRLLRTLAEHRQHGSDLVYEAYTVDIGGSE